MFLSPLAILGFGAGAYAVTIGPTTSLYIGNSDIAPDGYTRSYVSLLACLWCRPKLTLSFPRAVLAGDSSSSLTFPGPVITGTKVTPIITGHFSSPI